MAHLLSADRALARCVAAWLLCVLGLFAAQARAQRAIDIELWKPAAGQSAALTIPEPELPAHGSVVLGLSTSYARDPLERKLSCDPQASAVDPSCTRGDRGRRALSTDLVELEASFAISLYDTLQLGLAMPVALAREGDDLGAPHTVSNHVAPGDLRLSALGPVVSGDTALALGFVASLPSGTARDLVGDRNWMLMPEAVLRQRLAHDKAALSLALGYRLRERTRVPGLDLELDDELDLATGARVSLASFIDLRAELIARVGLGGTRVRGDENPIEADLAAGLKLAHGVWLALGGGAGLFRARAAYAAPSVRVLASLRYQFEAVTCRYGPEDYDGFEDGDHCRDPDNDGDGIPDEADACPNDAEDRDGFEDSDGCPDFDDDADGLPDARDRCPRRSEDRDGFEDDDGCPEPDNDADGVADAADACPMDPEDRDGFEDADGCPEPGPEPASITLTEGRILVSEHIYFDYDRDTIRSVSTPLLDQLGRVISSLPAGVKVMVAGHTDDSGNADYNLDLSHRRARAVVEYLHARGVPSERLDFIGYGASRPLAPNDNADARALNRRVEFLLVR